MPIEFSYDKERNLRQQIVTGSIVMDEFIAELRKIYASGDVPVRANVIWDLSQADVSQVSRDDVRQLATFVQSAWRSESEFKAAIFVGSDLVFGMSRMYEQLLGLFNQDNIRIFRSESEAWEWMQD